MDTTWLLTGKKRTFTGRIARIFNFVEGRMSVDANESRVQLIDKQVCLYYAAVRVGTQVYFERVREHFAPDPTKPGGIRGGVINERWVPPEHRIAVQSSGQTDLHRQILPTGPSVQGLPTPIQGGGLAPTGAGGSGYQTPGGVSVQSDLPEPKASSDEALRSLVLGLDPNIGDFWTSTGQPRIEAIQAELGWKPSREQINSVAPNHDRDTARIMRTIEG